MTGKSRRIDREWQTLKAMISLYCKDRHGSEKGLCQKCDELQDFARFRLEKCPYEEEKPTCSNCPIHCYRPDRREEIREVMRHAGPRMLKRHPILAMRHLIDGRREAPPLKRSSQRKEKDS